MVLLLPWQDIDLWPLCLTGSIPFWKNLAFICSSFLPKMRCLVCIILYKYVRVCVWEREWFKVGIKRSQQEDLDLGELITKETNVMARSHVIKGAVLCKIHCQCFQYKTIMSLSLYPVSWLARNDKSAIIYFFCLFHLVGTRMRNANRTYFAG